MNASLPHWQVPFENGRVFLFLLFDHQSDIVQCHVGSLSRGVPRNSVRPGTCIQPTSLPLQSPSTSFGQIAVSFQIFFKKPSHWMSYVILVNRNGLLIVQIFGQFAERQQPEHERHLAEYRRTSVAETCEPIAAKRGCQRDTSCWREDHQCWHWAGRQQENGALTGKRASPDRLRRTGRCCRE